MRLFSKKSKLLLVSGAVLVAVLVAVVNFTNVCRLEAVTLNSEPIADWSQRFDMLRETSVFRQQLDSLARVVLNEAGTFKVDASVSWPHTLNIRTNVFSPTCFLLDKSSGQLLGVEATGRIIPLQNSVTDWERPVLTGVSAGRTLGYCQDVRVKDVVDQLERLRKSNTSLFRLLDEIDFESKDYIQVSIAGLPYRLKAQPGRLSEELGRFIAFIIEFSPNLDGVSQLDLRFGNTIVSTREKH